MMGPDGRLQMQLEETLEMAGHGMPAFHLGFDEIPPNRNTMLHISVGASAVILLYLK